MQKRIAMITVHECPLASSEGKERGGINVYTYELSKALARLGWQIDAFTRVQDDVNPRIVDVSENFRVVHLPNGPHTPLNKKAILADLPEFTQGLSDHIRKNHISYGLMHAHYYLSGLVAVEANKLLSERMPIITTFHTLGLLKQLTVASDLRDDPDERVAIEHRLVDLSDHIITTSENTKTYLTSLYGAAGKKVTTIPPGVDTTLFRPGDKAAARISVGNANDGLTVLAVGHIDPVKGFDVLLYAIKILLHTHPELATKICLSIIGGDVGDNPSRSRELTKLNHLRKTLNLETTVQFIRPQPQEKLVEYYRAADVLVMPSHYESFGMVALEAIACGTPVITTDVTGVSPLLQTFPKGHIISANNPIMLAKVLAHVLSHPPDSNTFMPDVIDSYSWTHIGQRVAAVYEGKSYKDAADTDKL